MKKISLLIAVLALNITTFAQKIGEWTAHTPGKDVICVEIMHDNIYAATPHDIFYYNTNDNSINHLSKVNGLSDIGISIIKYSASQDILFVGYTNTNIDIIDNQGDIVNIPDIHNKYILGNKTINNVFMHEHLAYVCCSFGIVVIDLNRYEVKDTYIIGPNGSYLSVNDLTLLNNVFYAATERGIYFAKANSANLADFSQWKRYTNHIPNATSNFSHIVTFDDCVVANYSDGTNDTDLLLAINDTTSWGYFLNGPQNLISDLRVCNDRLVITEDIKSFKVYDQNRDLIFGLSGYYTQSAVYDKARNLYWAGSKLLSLGKITTDSLYHYVIKNGPYSAKAYSINASGNDIWVAGGGYTSTWAKTWNHDGFSRYDGSKWSYINSWNVHAFDSISDITWVKSDPRNSNIVYAASYHKGLMVFNYGECTDIYSYYNSSLELNLASLVTGKKYVYITGFDYDSNNNMWIANSGTNNMLSEWKTDGSWKSYNIGTSDIGRIMVDKNDIKWIYKRGGELILFKDGTVRNVNKAASTGNLPGDANCFVTDNNGTVWVGTTDGVALFYDSQKIFKNSAYECSKILIPRNDGSGQADYLLSGLSVLAIAVDGANNLWFGTTNGVIHTSNDGQTTYHHFTVENSPLFSNTVTDIAIDDDGNIYFGTDQGILSYKGTATKGMEANSNVIVYPNPVRPEHRGIVGIKGLVTDALVKITTTNGSFVTHLRAEGGQAVWNCTDINGNNVEPGIYLIFVSDESGKETYATKVLIMK